MDFFASAINLKEVFVQLVAFLIILWVLKTFAWTKILNAMDARRERIRLEFEKIEQAKKEVESLRTTYEMHLAQIEDQAREKLQQVIADGKRISRELQDEARQNARSILDKAKSDIELEIDKAKASLQHEIAGLTILATERLLQRKIDAAKDEEIILDIIREIEKQK